jgi:choline dehydrogenase
MSDYDLIVVGAGSAGGVIAARVTEDPKQRVLLIEAGPDYSSPDGLPEDLQNGHHNSIVKHDWGFTYQPHARSRDDVPLPRGKVVGGSSAVNTCIALRGQPEDYDEWASIAGPEWAWAKCLPAFIRLETDQDIRNELHGSDGPLPLRRYRYEELVPAQRAFIDACRALGYPECPDHNDPATTGHGPHPMNKRDGWLRVSVAMAYLMPVRHRPNLTVRPNTVVRRVVLSRNKVTGLEVETDGAVETIDAERVVLSAGAIQSPAVLVRSGIGPKETLEALGIGVARDLAVGRRLFDHPASLVALRAKPGVVSHEHPMIQTTLRYTAKGSQDFNDMQLEPLSYLQRQSYEEQRAVAFGLAPVVEKTRGHGRLVFTSADPHCQPLIQTDFLNDEWDVERMVEGVEIALRMTETPVLRELIEGMIWPREEVAADRALLRDWVRRACGSGYHPCGTAPMGAAGGPDAVVDQSGRVFGVEGLIVADASIMPTIPRANINIPTIMIGERFGEWLREGAI